MPVTPRHMGPGILLKALLPSRFSLMVLGWAQIVMDLQPLLAMVAALSDKCLGEPGLHLVGPRRPLPIRWAAAWLGAGIGTASHVLLDSLVHADIRPWVPFSAANGLLGRVVEWLCLASGALGGALYPVVARRRDGPAAPRDTDPR